MRDNNRWFINVKQKKTLVGSRLIGRTDREVPHGSMTRDDVRSRNCIHFSFVRFSIDSRPIVRNETSVFDVAVATSEPGAAAGTIRRRRARRKATCARGRRMCCVSGGREHNDNNNHYYCGRRVTNVGRSGGERKERTITVSGKIPRSQPFFICSLFTSRPFNVRVFAFHAATEINVRRPNTCSSVGSLFLAFALFSPPPPPPTPGNGCFV